MGAAVIRLEQIRKTFPGGVLVLDDIDFELERGTVHILLSEKGAGKSTLVKILSDTHHGRGNEAP